MIIESGQERAVLEELPVAALRVGPAVVEGLEEVGVDRVGQVLALPRAALPARFGAELTRRIDQALGRVVEMVEAVRVVAAPRVERVFDGPTADWEAVSITARRLLAALVEELRVRECGVRRLDVELQRCGPGGKRMASAEVVIGLARATRDVRHLWSLLAPRLERVPLGEGEGSGDGVEGIALTARWMRRIEHEQAVCAGWGEAGEDEGESRAEAETVDTLMNRLGGERVVRAELAESHVPEVAVRWRVAGGEAGGSQESHAGGERIGMVGERPPVLLEEPSPARVVSVTPDGPVVRVRWMGEELEARLCIGPERIEGEWWRGGKESRDYYKVCDQGGRWLWMYRELESGGWFVQGVWG